MASDKTADERSVRTLPSATASQMRANLVTLASSGSIR